MLVCLLKPKEIIYILVSRWIYDFVKMMEVESHTA